MTVTNYKTGEVCVIEFFAEGWGGKNKHYLEGYCYESLEASKAKKNKNPIYKVYGTWTGQIHYQKMNKKNVDTTVAPVEVWEAKPFPEDFNLMYQFTSWTIQLNHLTEALKSKLPPTDSRLRSDQRALENGDLDLATSEKMRLEDKQRAMRAWREANPGNDFVPHYFVKEID